MNKISNSNIGHQLINNHIARRVGSEVQKRINALKIGQKMQDLPEELWHDDFKYYVKHDPNRKGGSENLRMIQLEPNKPSLTVTGYIFNKFVHPDENRFITVREAARLQGFPDNIKFEGTLTSTQLQVGNAVTHAVTAKAVFQHLTIQANLLGFQNRALKALSLFSGAGGMDIGAYLTNNIDICLAIDNWSNACSTLRGYFKENSHILEQDICTVKEPLSLWQEYSGELYKPDIVSKCRLVKHSVKQVNKKAYKINVE